MAEPEPYLGRGHALYWHPVRPYDQFQRLLDSWLKLWILRLDRLEQFSWRGWHPTRVGLRRETEFANSLGELRVWEGRMISQPLLRAESLPSGVAGAVDAAN